MEPCFTSQLDCDCRKQSEDSPTQSKVSAALLSSCFVSLAVAAGASMDTLYLIIFIAKSDPRLAGVRNCTAGSES